MSCSETTSIRSDISVLKKLFPGSGCAKADIQDPLSGERKSRKPPFAISVQVLKGGMRALDTTLLFACIVLISCLRSVSETPIQNQEILTAVIGAGVTAFLLGVGQRQSLTTLRSVFKQITGILTSLTAGLITIFITLRLTGALQKNEVLWALSWFISAAALLAVARFALIVLVSRWNRLGYLTKNFVVIGANELGASVVRRAREAGSELCFLGLYDDNPTAKPDINGEVQGGVADLIRRSRFERIDAVIIAVPLAQASRVANLTEQLSVTVSDIYLAAEFPTVLPSNGCAANAINRLAILISHRPLKDWEAFQKRTFDLTVAALAIVFLFPILLMIALIIKFDSAGPVLFRQPRLGYNNLLFDVYKFRTMHHHMADLHADLQTKKDDKRVTSIGRWLRKLSLDELPQLFNVLAGEMSLVGPRPHAINTKAGEHRFTEVVAGYALRHRVRPGITGWAQVNGWRGETRTLDQIESRVAHDLYYIDNWSLLLDMKIMVLTVLREIASPHAY